MLNFKHRFHGHGSIRYVYSRGQAVRSRQLTIKHVENKRRSHPRIAVVISKKVLKSAVGRNRVRRRLYELLRLRLPHLPPQTDLVLIVGSAELREMPIAELSGLLDSLLTQAGLNKSPQK